VGRHQFGSCHCRNFYSIPTRTNPNGNDPKYSTTTTTAAVSSILATWVLLTPIPPTTTDSTKTNPNTTTILNSTQITLNLDKTITKITTGAKTTTNPTQIPITHLVLLMETILSKKISGNSIQATKARITTTKTIINKTNKTRTYNIQIKKKAKTITRGISMDTILPKNQSFSLITTI